METKKVERIRVKGWAYTKKFKRYREDVIAYQSAVQKSFSKHNATIFFLFGIVLLLLDQFLWKELHIGTLLYFVVSMFSVINYICCRNVFPKHNNWIIPAGCIYIFIMGNFLLSLNLIGGETVSRTLFLCVLVSTSIVIIVPGCYMSVMLLATAMHMIETVIVNGTPAYILYNLMDDIVICAFCIGTNVIFSKIKYEELERKENIYSECRRDSLTGLYNRRFLERYFEECADWHSRCAILMLDLDNFKKANDLYGHKKGDEVLCQVARILREKFKESDCVARLGGDEFLVFVPDVTKAEVIMNCVERVLECFPIALEGKMRVEVSASVGVAFKEAEQVSSYTELYAKADEAMYRAKKTGKAKAVVAGKEDIPA